MSQTWSVTSTLQTYKLDGHIYSIYYGQFNKLYNSIRYKFSFHLEQI